MRQIRFRVWNPSAKQMLYPDNEDGTIALTLDGRVFIGDWSAWDFEIDPPYSASRPLTPEPVLMLSTGLKDKNGREIFEGDILREEYTVSQGDDCGRKAIHTIAVEWDEKNAGFSLFYDETDYGREANPAHSVVIGNIYESQEIETDTIEVVGEPESPKKPTIPEINLPWTGPT